MITVLLIAGGALVFAVLACVVIASPSGASEMAAALAGMPFATAALNLPVHDARDLDQAVQTSPAHLAGDLTVADQGQASDERE
jgi:hypothetical protein